MANEGLYDKLVGKHYTVKLPNADFDLTCRDVPFITLMSIISSFTASANEEINALRANIIEQIRISGPDVSNLDQMATNYLWPLLLTAVYNSREYTKLVIENVAVDVDDRIVNMLSVEDSIVIIKSALDRIDVESVSEKINEVFTKAAELFNQSMEDQKEQIVQENPQLVKESMTKE